MKEFTITFYYLNDYSEKVYHYNVCAYSEKQARFFLGRHLGCNFANSLKQGYAIKHSTSNNVVILTSISSYEISEEFKDKYFIGKIQMI